MADRRVLILDNDSDFLELVRGSLAPYGFEVQMVEAESEGIQRIKALKPDAVFVAAESSEKAGLALCSKAKKVAGSKIPVILATATLSKQDIELHSTLRHHADAYLDKHSLSPDQFLQKVEKLINLAPRDTSFSLNDSEALELPADSGPSGIDDSESAKGTGASIPTPRVAKAGELAASFDGEPTWLKKLFDEVTEGDRIDKPADSNQTNLSVDRLAGSYNNLEHRLIQQEKEIMYLRKQLEDAQQAASSSPFSSDFLNLREGTAQKEREIIRLTEKFQANKRKILTGEKNLKELAKRLLEVKTELNRRLDQEGKLKTRYEDTQLELAKLNTAFEEARQRNDSEIARLKTDHQAALKQAKEDQHAQREYEEARSNLRKEQAVEIAKINAVLEESQQGYETEIDELKTDHQDALKKAQEEHGATQDRLKKQIQELKIEAKTTAKDDSQKEIEKMRREYEDTLSILRKEHSAEIAKVNAALEKSRQEHEDTLSNLRKEHSAEMAKINAVYEKSRQGYETVIDELKTGHQNAVKQTQEEHRLALKTLKKQIQEAKKQAKTAYLSKAPEGHETKLVGLDKKYKQELQTLDKQYTSQIAQIKDKHKAEIKILKKKTAEEAQKVADKLAQEKEAHQKTRQHFESRIATLLTAGSKR